MILLDKNEISFPDPSLYHPEDGLIALGGDLAPERILLAYQLGIFPWFNPGEEILWWSPDPRFVLFPKDLKISKSMKKVFRNNKFRFTENQCFEEVMKICGAVSRKDQDGTWISDDMLKAYTKLHQIGKVKSVEVWENEKLVGGLYGVDLGHVFCGESMFAKVSNASKAGFIWFVEKHKSQYKIIDCQIHTQHLESLGAKYISKNTFLNFINKKL